ncbi:membrane fusion protein (multidrug efflux system) [Novosphingobium kunmingense]|uniref:Membrane fusion protein (Multidrug efflux system) n=1 Tax=Novosphingobium kunmingense TaxID=1211806 RepID=A0A2N0I3Y9_9SPHN|nr:HlyD family secretion protein [Novosphingobium kunmingense]PKB25891.1 membrane fusion protein (multidrug efflux system) [Novosphingobium kunmingense]
MADRDPAIVKADSTPVASPVAEELAAPPAKAPGKLRRVAVMGLVPLLIIGGAVTYWYTLQGKVSTDNAYVQQDKVSVSAEVGGKIASVGVREDQNVKVGDVLFTVDPSTYQIQLAQADAAIATAQASATALANSSDLSGADASAAREDIGFAQANLARQQALWNRGFTTKAAYEAAQHQVAQAREQLRLAEARQVEARAKLATGSQVPGVLPAIAAAQAQRRAAELALTRTVVRAPMAGRVSQADRLQIGQEIVSGLPVVTIVKNTVSYVEANFKETDLADMRVGQPATIELDAYPGVKLKGHVSSIGAGTGSEFSVLPAQNATGNWVKVTQRVPVRIAIDEASPRPLLAGLSSHVTVDTDGKR